jgi:transcriptional regulator with XRE-family HTH domain
MLNDRLRCLRISAGYKQEDIAMMLDIKPNTYANYERGARKPSYETLLKLSKIYNLAPDELLESYIEIQPIHESKEVDSDKKVLGDRLRYLRINAGYRQEDIAAILEMKCSRYSTYERGESKPSYETLLKLSKVYNLALDELLDSNIENESLPESEAIVFMKKVMVDLGLVKEGENMSDEKLKIIGEFLSNNAQMLRNLIENQNKGKGTTSQ